MTAVFILILLCLPATMALKHHPAFDMTFSTFRQLSTQNSNVANCLDTFQYGMFRHALVQPVWTVFSSDLAGGMSLGNLGIGPLLQIGTKPLCAAMKSNLVPCMQLMAPRMKELVKCVNPELTQYSEASVHDLIDTFHAVFCASTKVDGVDRLCGQVIGNALDGVNGNDQILAKAMELLGNCDAKLGCCGANIVAFSKSVQSLNLAQDVLLNFASNASCSVQEGCSLELVDRPSVEDYRAAESITAEAGISSGPPTFDFEDDEPQQVHLAVASNAQTEMVVMWHTAIVATSSVVYGTSAENLNLRTNGTSSTYLKGLESVNVTATYNHVVELKGLKSDTKYYYQCVSNGKTSAVYSFQTAGDVAFSAAIFGDMGLYESESTVELLKSVDVDMYMHVGDVSYADNWLIHNLATFGYEKVWNDFLNVIMPFAANKPYMVVAGNHETECHSPFVCLANQKLKLALGNFTAFNHRFQMPSKGSNGVDNLWYSFDYGAVHFVVISAETNFPGSPDDTYTGESLRDFGDQPKWLENDLRLAYQNRDNVPFVIVLGHRPVYTIYSSKEDEPIGQAAKLQAWLEPLFEKYKVDMYISGHVHSYERQSPIYESKPYFTSKTQHNNPGHTMYIVHGSSGNEESLNTIDKPKRKNVPSWSISNEPSQLGVGLLHIDSKTKLRWEYISATSKQPMDTLTVDITGRDLPPLQDVFTDSHTPRTLPSILSILLLFAYFI